MRLIIACACFIIAALCCAEMARASETIDSNSGLHFGVSAGLGFMAGVATQKIETPWLRRTVAGTVCMIPGGVKEATDATFSGADLAFDAIGCAVGILAFERLNIYLTSDSIHVAGTW